MNPAKKSPRTLEELNNALAGVDHVNTFFNMDLRVVSKDQRFVLKKVDDSTYPTEKYERAYSVLAEIVNIFMRTAPRAENAEIHRFKEGFSNYCRMLLSDKWSPSFISFVECAQYGVKEATKNFGQSDTLQLLLVTDVDYQEHGPMAIRACRALVQGLPVIMPYALLCDIINYAFTPSILIHDFENSRKISQC